MLASRIWLKWVAWTVVCVLAAVVVLLALLHTGPVQQALTDRGLRMAQPLNITADSIRFNLFKARAEIRNLSIRAKDDVPAFVTIREATVGWDYLALNKGLDAIAGVRARGVDVNILQLEDGKLNLPESKEGGTTPKGMVRSIDVDELSVSYVNAPVSLQIPYARLMLTDHQWRLLSDQPSSITASGFSAFLERMDYQGSMSGVSLETLTAEGHIDSSQLQIEGVGPVVASTGFRFDGAGKRVDFNDLHAKAELGVVEGSGSLSIEDEPSHADLIASGQGVTAKAKLEWPGVDAIKATGNASVIIARKDAQGRASVDLQPSQIRINTPGIQGYGANVRGAASIQRSNYALSGRLTGDYAVLDGQVNFTANLGGTVQAPRAGVEAESRNLKLGTVAPVTLHAIADANLQEVLIHEATVSLNDQEVNASGKVLLAGPKPQLDIQAQATDLQIVSLLEATSIEFPADGLLSLTANIRGDAEDPSIEADVHARELITYGEKLGTLTAKATYGNSVVNLDELLLTKPQESGPGTLSAKGWVELDSKLYSLDVKSDNLYLESLKIPDAGVIRAAVELDVRGRSSLDYPSGHANLTLDSPSMGKVTTSASIQNQTLAFSAESPEFRLDEFGVNGKTSFSLKGESPWGKWQEMTASMTIPTVDVIVGQHEIKNQGPIELAIQNWNLIVNRVEAVSDDATFSVKGRLPIEHPDQTAQLDVAGTVPLSLAQRYAPEDIGLLLTGDARIEGTVKGTVLQPEPLATLTIADAEVTSPKLKTPVRNLNLRATATGKDLVLNSLDAKVAEGTLHGEARLPFSENELKTAVLIIDKIDPTAFFLPPERRLRGITSMRLDASTRHFDLEDIVATARFTELGVKGQEGAGLNQAQDTLIEMKSGRVTLQKLEIAGGTTNLHAEGTVDLLRDQALDFQVRGSLPADILTRATTDYGLAGQVQTYVVARGTINDPRITGTVTLGKGQVFSADPPLAADNVTMSVTFDGPEINIAKLEGYLNGGTFNLRGKFRVIDGGISQPDLRLIARSVFLDYPRGFQTASNLNLTLKQEGRNLVLGGRATILDGAYREGIDLMMFTRSSQREVSLVSEPIRFLENLRFNIAINTQQPIIMDNNLGRLQTYADLRLVGTPQRPGLTGRLEIEENGKIYFGGRTFSIASGIIDFTDETKISPRFNIAADTRISTYDVTLKLTGDINEQITTSFTSEPSMSEDRIMALLFTGSADNVGRGSAYAQTQMLTLFGTGLTGGISTRLRNTFGLSEFRIDPGLLSADSDPTARLTIGQNLTPELKLTYSYDLTDSQDQIWIAEYDWRRRFLARYFRQADQSNRMEFRQKIRFGGGALTGDFSTRTRRATQRVNKLEITGNPIFDEKTILKRLRLKEGGKYDFLKIQGRLDKLRRFYADKGYAEVRITQTREIAGQQGRGQRTRFGRRQRELRPQDPDVELPDEKLNLVFNIEAGQPVRFVYEGDSPSKKVRNRITQIWQQGIIDQQRSRTALTELRRSFQRSGYADAETTIDIKEINDTKTIVFEVNRGKKYDRPVFHFPDLPQELAEELQDALRRQKLDVEARGNPQAVVTFLQKYLVQQGYLTVKVGEPESSVINDDELIMNIPLESVQKFRFGEIRFEGRKSIPEQSLRQTVVFQTGDEYAPEDRFTVSSRVQQSYWNSGYRRAEVDVEEVVNAATGRADLVIKIDEKQKYEISAIDIQGLVKTNEAFVRRRLDLKEGDILNAQKVNDSRRKILDSGAYNLLDFTYPPMGTPASPDAPQPVEWDIRLREPKPFRLDYGLTYDTERSFGVITDISTVNTLGEARVLGLRSVVDRQRQEYRLYFTQPFLGRKQINTTGQIFAIRDRPANTGLETLETGIAVQQFVRFGPRFTFTYGYRHAYADFISDALGENYSGRTAPLTSTLTRDSRDNALDATKGSFISNAIEYAPRITGGNINYYRFYFQGFKYFGLTKPSFMPFEGDRKRSHTVFATGVRFGVADNLYQRAYTPFTRFFAGGGTSIRGYSQNSIGPSLEDGSPAGGRATFILNNELRFPLYKWLDGVGFLDAGNVWENPSDMRITSLRAGTGFGLRIRNPFVVIRLDYGIKLGRRPGESIGGFFFSIGQAF